MPQAPVQAPLADCAGCGWQVGVLVCCRPACCSCLHVAHNSALKGVHTGACLVCRRCGCCRAGACVYVLVLHAGAAFTGVCAGRVLCGSLPALHNALGVDCAHCCLRGCCCLVAVVAAHLHSPRHIYRVGVPVLPTVVYRGTRVFFLGFEAPAFGVGGELSASSSFNWVAFRSGSMPRTWSSPEFGLGFRVMVQGCTRGGVQQESVSTGEI